MTATPTPVSELSYEAAREELITIVADLEAGTASLADSMTLWERGEELAQHCQSWLTSARERLAAAEAEIEAAHAKGQEA